MAARDHGFDGFFGTQDQLNQIISGISIKLPIFLLNFII